MTNRENLIAALQDKHDDWAWSEATIAYDIDCPYSNTEGHPCDNETYPWSMLKVCGPCKMEWLDKEVGR